MHSLSLKLVAILFVIQMNKQLSIAKNRQDSLSYHLSSIQVCCIVLYYKNFEVLESSTKHVCSLYMLLTCFFNKICCSLYMLLTCFFINLGQREGNPLERSQLCHSTRLIKNTYEYNYLWHIFTHETSKY